MVSSKACLIITVLICCFCAAFSVVSAEASISSDVHGEIAKIPKDIFRKNPIRIIVDSGEYATYVGSDGGFSLYGLPPGAHIVDFASNTHVFPQLLVEVSGKTGGKYRVRVNDGSKRVLGGSPIQVEPLGKATYFVPREQSTVLDIFKNPMILLMMVSMGMAWLMPKIADQDEMKAQMKEMMSGVQQKQEETNRIRNGR